MIIYQYLPDMSRLFRSTLRNSRDFFAIRCKIVAKKECFFAGKRQDFDTG